MISVAYVSRLGVIGGVALLVLIAGVALFLVHYSRKPEYQGPPSNYAPGYVGTTYPSNTGQPVMNYNRDGTAYPTMLNNGIHECAIRCHYL